MHVWLYLAFCLSLNLQLIPHPPVRLSAYLCTCFRPKKTKTFCQNMFSVGIPIVCFPITDAKQMLNYCIFFYYFSTLLIYFQLLYRSRLPIFNHLGKEFPAFCIRKRFNALFKNVCASPVQNQMNPVNVVTYSLSMICLNIIFPTIPNLQTGCSCLLRALCFPHWQCFIHYMPQSSFLI
jgi:hypothetical protein